MSPGRRIVVQVIADDRESRVPVSVVRISFDEFSPLLPRLVQAAQLLAADAQPITAALKRWVQRKGPPIARGRFLHERDALHQRSEFLEARSRLRRSEDGTGALRRGRNPIRIPLRMCSEFGFRRGGCGIRSAGACNGVGIGDRDPIDDGQAIQLNRSDDFGAPARQGRGPVADGSARKLLPWSR